MGVDVRIQVSSAKLLWLLAMFRPCTHAFTWLRGESAHLKVKSTSARCHLVLQSCAWRLLQIPVPEKTAATYLPILERSTK